LEEEHLPNSKSIAFNETHVTQDNLDAPHSCNHQYITNKMNMTRPRRRPTHTATAVKSSMIPIAVAAKRRLR
jgi:hypothetical protein